MKQQPLHSFIAINSSLYLYAAVESARNQCVVQLVRGLQRHTSNNSYVSNCNNCNYTSGSKSKTESTHQQCSKLDVNELSYVNETHIPIHILAALRIPHIIEVIEHQEGKITTVSLALYESSCTATTANTEENHNNEEYDRCLNDDDNEKIDSVCINISNNNNNNRQTYVLLFIGTSNGTMLVCNALRGTILVIARFNEYHTAYNINNEQDGDEKNNNNNINSSNFSKYKYSNDKNQSEVREKVHTVTHDDKTHTNHKSFEQHSQSYSNNSEETKELVQREGNDAIVKFAMIYNTCDHENTNNTVNNNNNKNNNNNDVNVHSNHFNICYGSLTSCKIMSVYVVHATGKVAVLDRSALDVLIKVIVERQDGRRPYFFLEWPFERLPNKNTKRPSFPAVGPGYAMADFINSIYALSPYKNYSSVEMSSYYMASVRTSAKHYCNKKLSDHYKGYSLEAVLKHDSFLPSRLISDAVVLPIFLHREINYALETGLQQAMTLLVCGCFPAFAVYTIDNTSLTNNSHRQHSLFLSSAKEAVHAMKFVVSGLAKSIWHSTVGGRDEQEKKKENQNYKKEELIEEREEKSNQVDGVAMKVAATKSNMQSACTDTTQSNQLFTREAKAVSHNYEEEQEHHNQNQESYGHILEEANPPEVLSKQMTTCTLEPESTFLQADVTFSKVELDARSGYAALYAERQGRLFVVDSHTGIVHRIIKGCRAASFHWCHAKLHSSSAALSLLLVHLPLRHLVEVYSLKAHKRIACCHVPQNAVLLSSSQMHCQYTQSAICTNGNNNRSDNNKSIDSTNRTKKCVNTTFVTTLAYFLDSNGHIFCVNLHAGY